METPSLAPSVILPWNNSFLSTCMDNMERKVLKYFVCASRQKSFSDYKKTFRKWYFINRRQCSSVFFSRPTFILDNSPEPSTDLLEKRKRKKKSDYKYSSVRYQFNMLKIFMEYLEEDSYCARVFLRKKMLKLRKVNNAMTFMWLNNWSGGGMLLFFCSGI